MIGKPHVEEWYRKEFIYRMQNQGKLPKYTTEAHERKEAADFETHHRVFPGAYNKHSALEQMLQQAGVKIAANRSKTAELAASTPGYASAASAYSSAASMLGSAAASAGPGSALSAVEAVAAVAGDGGPVKKDRTARNALKARLTGVEQQLGNERKAREELERQMYNLSRGSEA